MSDSVERFARLLQSASPLSSQQVPLTNVTFFLGAGFSKAWNDKFPVGNDLFSFGYREWLDLDGPLEEFLMLNNYKTLNLDISASMFKDIVYQIGMMKKYPELRPRYIDDQNLEMVEKHLRFMIRKKFEKTAPLYFEENGKVRLPSKFSEDQKRILKFFYDLERSGDGSQGVPEGLRANYLTTNYDFVIEAILDHIVGEDDFYRLYKYRGITPTRFSGQVPETTVFDHWMTGNLLKINGGFEVFKAGDGFEFDYREQKSEKALRENPPQLMLASREQDYTQAYFRAMFPKVIRLLQETRVLVVVGYSLPEEDALLRLILRQFAEDRADGSSKGLFYIDRASVDDQRARVNGVFPHMADIHGLNVFPYSGSFASWCGDVVTEVKRLNATPRVTSAPTKTGGVGSKLGKGKAKASKATKKGQVATKGSVPKIAKKAGKSPTTMTGKKTKK